MITITMKKIRIKAMTPQINSADFIPTRSETLFIGLAALSSASSAIFPVKKLGSGSSSAASSVLMSAFSPNFSVSSVST